MAKRLAKCSQLLKIHCHFCRGNKDNCIVYSHKCALAKEDGPECNKDILKLMEKHFKASVCFTPWHRNEDSSVKGVLQMHSKLSFSHLN